MGYLNNVLGYRDDLLASRSIVRHGNYALLTPDGLVKNVIPGFEHCDVTILSTPKLGATFVDYLVTLHENGGHQSGFGGEGIETFLYVIKGEIIAGAQGKSFALTEGGYLYCPPGERMTFSNNHSADSQLFLYKRRYIPTEGHAPYLVTGNVSQLERIHYEGMEDVILIDFLPKELGFDMNMHILSFAPGASHGYIETHVQSMAPIFSPARECITSTTAGFRSSKAIISLWALTPCRRDTASDGKRSATSIQKTATATLRSDG